jgi:hypothetical protein
MSLTMRLWQKGEHKTRVLSGLISSDVTDDGAQARREMGSGQRIAFLKHQEPKSLITILHIITIIQSLGFGRFAIPQNSLRHLWDWKAMRDTGFEPVTPTVSR